MHNQEPVPDNEMHKILLFFEIQTDHLISARRQDLERVNKNLGICQLVDFAVPANHMVKQKKGEKRNTYMDLHRKLIKELWHMKVKVIRIGIGALTTVTERLFQGLNY